MKFFNSQKPIFIYMIGDDGAILLHLEKGQVERRLFAASPDLENTQIFLDLLRKHPTTPIYGFVDIMDQSYVRHSLPPVSSLGVKKLVQRRLDRDFPKDDVKSYLSIGREKKGRKDWNFLLISLSYNEQSKAWLELVYEEENRFAGIYLVPVECENIISKLHNSYKKINEAAANNNSNDKNATFTPTNKNKPAKKNKRANADSGWQILVSHNKVGGFRQVVIKNNKLIFTRLAQAIDSQSPEVLAGNVEQEIQSTIEYIKRLSYSSDSPLDIYVIVAPEIKSFVSGAGLEKNTFLHSLTPFEAAEILKIQNSVLYADLYGDIVLAATFGNSKRKRLKLNSVYPKKLDFIYLLRNMGRVIGALAITGIITASIFSMASWYTSTESRKDIEKFLSFSKSELTKLQKASKDIPANAKMVSDLLYLNDILSKKNTPPLEFIKRLRLITNDFIIIKKIEWSKSTALESSDKEEETPTSVKLWIEATYRTESWEKFSLQMDNYFKEVENNFNDFEIIHEDIFGENRAASDVHINFEDQENSKSDGPSQGETFTILIEMSSIGEKKESSISLYNQEDGGVL